MSEKSVGERIAALRAAPGLTGIQLGHALGLTKSQVSKIENGTRKLVVCLMNSLSVRFTAVGSARRAGVSLRPTY